MTSAQAYKLLGLPASASFDEVCQASERRKTELRWKLVPGLPAQVRNRAVKEMGLLVTAQEVLGNAGANKGHPQRPRQGPHRPPAAQPAGGAKPAIPSWSDFVSLFPFSRGVSVAVLISTLLMGVLGLSSCVQSCAQVLAQGGPVLQQGQEQDHDLSTARERPGAGCAIAPAADLARPPQGGDSLPNAERWGLSRPRIRRNALPHQNYLRRC